MSASTKNYWIYEHKDKSFLLVNKAVLDDFTLPVDEYVLSKIPLVVGLRFIQEFGQLNGHIPRFFSSQFLQRLIQAASANYLSVYNNREAIDAIFNDHDIIFPNYSLRVKAICEALGNFYSVDGKETEEDYFEWRNILINIYQGGS